MGHTNPFRLALILGLASATLIGCTRFRFDGRRKVMEGRGNQMWAVGLKKFGHHERIHSFTRLNGGDPMPEKPSAVIASGSAGNWQWEVRCVPSLLQSWKAWEQNEKVRQRAAEPDQWNRSAATWNQAFTRAHQTARYLLGRPPLPLKLTLFLVPEGSKYKKHVVAARSSYVPLTLAFYYPSGTADNDELTTKRFSAMVKAVATSIYEYQHILVDTETIQPVGKDLTDKTINDEARSKCWSDSVSLALTSGSHSEHRWDPAQERRELIWQASYGKASPASGKALQDQVPARQYVDAWSWGHYLETKSVFSYLQKRNIGEAKILSNEPEKMNAVMSACRALTQHPRDLTQGDFPSSEIEYAPFFSSSLGSPSSDAHADPK